MDEQSKRGLRIFLQYWVLIAILATFNFYKYFTGKNILSLIIAILCTAIFVGWVLFYLYYVRGKE
jgi:hypothetical protein